MSLPPLLLPLAAVVFFVVGCGSEAEVEAENPGKPTSAMAVPAASGSASPRLTAGPDNDLILNWLEPDDAGYRLRFAVLQGAAWGAPQTVARGDDWFVNWADFPSVVPISDTLLAAHWLVRQPAGGYAYDVLFSLSGDTGRTWSEPVMPHDDGTPTEHGFVTLFAQAGSVGVVWLDGRNTAEKEPPAHLAQELPQEPSHETHRESPNQPLRGMTLRAAAFAEDLSISQEQQIDPLICDCCQTGVAITDSGPVAVYRDRTAEETRDIYVALHRDGAWQAGQPVANDGWIIGGCPVNGPAIAADGNHVAVAWFTAANDQPRVRVARSRNGGDSFLTPLEINDGETYGRVGVAMLGDGDLAVSWLCKRDDGTAAMCLRAVTSDDQMGPVHVISGTDEVPAFSVPQLARSGEFLHAAWTVSEKSGGGIRTSRIPIASLR